MVGESARPTCGTEARAGDGDGEGRPAVGDGAQRLGATAAMREPLRGEGRVWLLC